MKIIGLILLFLLLGCDSDKEIQHRLDNAKKFEKQAKIKVDQKLYLYDKAFKSDNKEVACKISREIIFWSLQTHDSTIIDRSHELQIKACRK